MPIKFQCSCGRWLKTREAFAGKRCRCPTCASVLQVPEAADASEHGGGAHTDSGEASSTQSEPLGVREFLDPPAAPVAAETAATAAETVPVLRRMFEALLDPRSIQWMLMIGGGLCVLGLVIWLVSLGVFENPRVLAVAMGIGSLAVLAAGWFVALRTKYRVAGQALTFLGCVVAPLNLWFYHAQRLLTVDGHLWVGGVVCCLLYAATVVVLRDPLFMYAFEAGATLTLLLLLADLGKIADATFLSLFFIVLGIASIHAERAFSPAGAGTFTRRKFGLPLFWSGHAQMALGLLVLLGSQILDWLLDPARALFGYQWPGTLLTDKPMLAGGLWLAAVYTYLYSDVVVRRIGVYLALAGFSLVMVEVTLLLGFNLPVEWVIAVLALTALAINVFHAQAAGPNEKLDRAIPPLAMVLSELPVLLGVVLHIRGTSWVTAQFEWAYPTGWEFVVAMLMVAAANRVSAFLCRRTNRRSSAVYFFFSAGGLLVAAAGLLRVLGMTAWSQQAPWMMLVPIAYLVGSRLWRGHTAERPLGWIAHTATAIILLHVFFASLQDLKSFVPMAGKTDSLLLGLVFTEATLFYVLAGLFRKRSANVYLAAAAACGALWQLMGYFGIDDTYYTMLYAGLGVACLVVARVLGLQQATVFRHDGEKSLVARGRGLAAYQSGNGILTVACLAALMQGLAGLAGKDAQWLDLGALATTAIATAVAIGLVPTEGLRRLYTTATVALAAVTFLRLNLLIDLSGWQKLELFCVAVGLVSLVASHIARFREDEQIRDETVSLGLWFGSLLATMPLLIAFVYHRWFGSGPSLYDEMALLTVTILMVVTGVSWQTKATTLFGGGLLALYLVVLVVSLTYRPQVAIGVYLAVGGALVFAAGIALSVYRDKLLELPDRISKHEGVFRILSWR